MNNHARTTQGESLFDGGKPATFEELRDRLIADGIAEVSRVYEAGDPKRTGAIEGFELCRSLSSREEFGVVLRSRESREQTLRNGYYDQLDKRADEPGALDRYWHHRYATLQVEWVLNCLLVAGWALPGDLLSGRAARKVAEVTDAE